MNIEKIYRFVNDYHFNFYAPIVNLHNVLLKYFALCLLSSIWVEAATAMEFEYVEWRGKIVLYATGEIVEGDADLFIAKFEEIPRSAHGVPIILLNSPGGSVLEALNISDFLDDKQSHMVIPDGALCASACASIIFIAGSYRTMEPFGAFGQHSCSVNGIQDQACNDILAEHAVSKGVAFGSVAAFVTYVPPAEIAWFTREELDCWGISKYPFSDESGFSKTDPCAQKLITGNYPSAQSAWRIDFEGNSFRAFVRPANDHLRELQLNIWCNESKAGILYLSMEIQGDPDTIGSAISLVTLLAPPIELFDTKYVIEKTDETYSRIIVEIPNAEVLPFLTKADELTFEITTIPPYETILARTHLASSRKALLFAANNCLM